MSRLTPENVGAFLLAHSPDTVRQLTEPELRTLAVAVQVPVEAEQSDLLLLDRIMLKMYGSENLHDFSGFDTRENTLAHVNVGPPALDSLSPRQNDRRDLRLSEDDPSDPIALRLALAKVELEKIKLAEESKRLEEREKTERERIGLERDRLRARVPNRESGTGTPRENNFDITRHIRMVPPFNENDPTGYFMSFERLAKNLKWPEDQWSNLLHSVLKGRALETITALSEEQAEIYEIVKDSVLRAYELVPEAYRLKFRNITKSNTTTYSQHLHDMRKSLNRWLHSVNLPEDNYDSELYKLMLFENFLNNLPKDIKVHLSDNRITDPETAATMADEYVLHHRTVFSTDHKSGYGGNQGQQRNQVNYNNNMNHQKSWHKNYNGPFKNPRTQSVSVATDKKNTNVSNPKSTESGTDSKVRPYDKSTGNTSLTCFYCGKSGHYARQCYQKQKDINGSKEKYLKDLKTVACIKSPWVMEKQDSFKEFRSQGSLDFGDDTSVKVKLVRDTGASHTLVRRGVLGDNLRCDQHILLAGVGGTVSAPLVEVKLACELYEGPARMAVLDTLPIDDADILLGNDLCGGKVSISPVVLDRPMACLDTDVILREASEIFPACAVTRAMNKKVMMENFGDLGGQEELGLDTLFYTNARPTSQSLSSQSEEDDPGQNKGTFRECQRSDQNLASLWREAEEDPSSELYIEGDLLLRRVVPQDSEREDEEWKNKVQIIAPTVYRKDILRMAHDGNLAGHLGIRKTLDRVKRSFYWPSVRRDVTDWCRSCDICQKVGKPNQMMKQAPLAPIPKFDEPFTRVMIDVVGPLPRTSNRNEYILTIMDMATRFPEAIPLRSVKAPIIAKELVKFFTRFGLPKEIQSDRGSNFTSHVLAEVLKELEVTQIHSTAYHPQSQGAIERFHQTLKSMIRKYCKQNEKDWDQGLHLLLFAIREVPNETLGYSPFQLLFAHEVRGPLELMKQKWMSNEQEEFDIRAVADLRRRMKKIWDLAKENFEKGQVKMKKHYDKKTVLRKFEPGEEVLLLTCPPGDQLSDKFEGPYKVVKKLSDVNYVISTPDKRRKEKLCHINLLKKYHNQEEVCIDEEEAPIASIKSVIEEEQDETILKNLEINWEENKSLETELPEKLKHLDEKQKKQMEILIMNYKDVFRDTPGRTHLMEHDIEVDSTPPVKQRAYRVNPNRAKQIEEELAYMLEHKMIEPCQSEWSSPITIVEKSGRSIRLCIDFRVLNKASKNDSYPLPRVDECVDNVGNAKYITKLDLLKGFWQVPLSKRAQDLCCFVTLGKSYKCLVMPFGLKNASATFQRLMNKVTADLQGCFSYIDDLVVYSDTWEEHLIRLEALLMALREANLVVKVSKCEFIHAQVSYLGYVVGHGIVAPPDAKVEALCRMPTPKSRKEVRRLLGMAGYYRRFVMNFSDLVAPLTDLLKKDRKFNWNQECDKAFDNLKNVMSSSPLLLAPDFSKPFKLAVDASQLGAGAVLLQDDTEGVERPVSYFSRKFNGAQLNYSTIEKELLALILSLQFYDAYISPADESITVYTDHHPLKYLSKFKNKNQRLTRWSLLLQEFPFNIIHVRGKDNVIPDLLSRI